MSSLIATRGGTTPQMREAFGDEALLEAALAFEAALAEAEAAEGLIPAAHAAAIRAACHAATFNVAALAEAAAHAGTLAIPLVQLLRARVAEADAQAAGAVHHGATSQDLADTALMLQAKAAMPVLQADVARARRAAAALAHAHAVTPMLGRTLLQPALPITFGLKAANWMAGLDAAALRLEDEAASALELQFGGATGSRVGLQGRGAQVAGRLAAHLGLADPPLPWQARRDGVAGLGCALAILTGALGKVARDLSLLAQGEVGEAFEPRVEERGGSSAMAHKRNPTGCQVALSAAARAPGLAATLLATLPGEHERGLGGWQAEGPVLAELFGLAHAAVLALAPVLEGLDVDAEAMARNLARAEVGADVGEAPALVAAALRRHNETLDRDAETF